MDFTINGNWVNFEYELQKDTPEKVAKEFIDQFNMGNEHYDVIKKNI